jgi:PhzF family phenazine biosynthesis protein
MPLNSVQRFAAFTDNPTGGNPAGVWLGETLPEPEIMLQIAAAVGFSETAFVAPAQGFERSVRYFSPEVEVPFCGHATIALGVALGRSHGPGTYQLLTPVGLIPVTVGEQDGQYTAALTSVKPCQKMPSSELVTHVLAAIDWQNAELDPTIPPMLAYAGAWHLVLAAQTLARLNRLDYDFDRLKELMQAHDLLTLQLVFRESATVFHARNPFPIGGVVEDPATGSAAAALGGYLRDAQLITVPIGITIRQGEAISRPSQIDVDIPITGGIIVRGSAVQLDDISHNQA